VRRNRDGIVGLGFDVDGEAREVTAEHAILCLPFAVLRELD